MTLGIEDGAFVVGGTTPFGLAVTRELVEHGARVLLVGPKLETLERVAEELGDQAVPCVADLADAEDAARVGGVAAALLGGVDGVVLTAGSLPEGDVFDQPDSEWLAAFSRSVWGPLGLLRGIVPLLEAEGGPSSSPFRPGLARPVALFDRCSDALLEELAGMLPPGVRLSRIEADPELAGTAARLLAAAMTRLVLAATCRSSSWRGAAVARHSRVAACIPDPGVRVPNVVSAEALRQADGSLLLWANTPEGIEAFRSRDGLVFRRAAGRMPLGAHPTVVRLPGGLLRMYYSTPDALPYEPSRVRSAVSRDGLVWFLEDGNRFADAGFGVMEVVPLEDGSWRLYLNDRPFKGPSRIVSGRSTKGITFHPERGIRLPSPYADPAVVRLASGRWLMVLSAIEPTTAALPRRVGGRPPVEARRPAAAGGREVVAVRPDAAPARRRSLPRVLHPLARQGVRAPQRRAQPRLTVPTPSRHSTETTPGSA